MSKANPFDPHVQENSLDAKLFVSLSKMADLFREMLWSKTQKIGISPIQLQFLFYIESHSPNQTTVSFLANKFLLTKATVSDSVKVLINKGLLNKEKSRSDSRSFYLTLTKKGETLIASSRDFSEPIMDLLNGLDKKQKNNLFTSFYQLLDFANQKAIIPVERTCFRCKFYEGNREDKHHCRLLKKNLKTENLRLDCNEFETLSL